jgi:hypothetical protein
MDFPGNANLPIGGLQSAIQENGVPGGTNLHRLLKRASGV